MTFLDETFSKRFAQRARRLNLSGGDGGVRELRCSGTYLLWPVRKPTKTLDSQFHIRRPFFGHDVNETLLWACSLEPVEGVKAIVLGVCS